MHDILIYGDIGPSYDWWTGEETGITGEWIAQALAEIPTSEKEVNVRINSVGGLTSEGITIRNQLRSFSSRRKLMDSNFSLRTIVDGYAYSAASTIMLGGDKIIMNSGSLAMIHKCWGMSWGNETDMRNCADYYSKVDTELAKLYAMKTGKKESEMMGLMTAETYFSAEEAVAIGLADEIDTTVVTSYGKYGNTFSKMQPGKYKQTIDNFRITCAKQRGISPLQNAKKDWEESKRFTEESNRFINLQTLDLEMDRVLSRNL